ncbi:MAG: transporter [Comamonadaceae bacterium]|nr:transporter [Comamonadaceae bacterium]
MNSDKTPKKPGAAVRLITASALALSALCAPQAQAQVPGRFYWHTLSDSNAVPLIFQSISGNSNPFDPANTVTPGAKIEATMALTGMRARSRWPTARPWPPSSCPGPAQRRGHGSGQDLQTRSTGNGFGDPMLEFNYNLIGPKAQKTIPDVLRYQPGSRLISSPIWRCRSATANSSQPLNLGQNRWYGRLGAPLSGRLGPWVPGRRTTLEFLPAVWLFGDNNNYVGQTLKTDPLFQLDAHLTRDFTESFWGSLDASWYNGGKASINGVAGTSLNNVGVGLTLGYQVNDNIGLTFGYKSTLNSGSDPTALRMDNFMFTLVFGWNPMLEGARRLKSEK